MKSILRALALTLTVMLLTQIQFAGASAANRSDAGLFGAPATYSPSIDRFYKWTGMLQRWHAAVREARMPCAAGQSAGCEPAEWRRMIAQLQPLDLKAKLAAANALINRYPYVSSELNWREPNHWEIPFEFLAKSGQCQDYAIAKFMLLRAAGVPNDALRIVVLRDLRQALDHAVLVAYVDGEAMLLDNQIEDVVPASQVRHYVPYYSINETGWWMHHPSPMQLASRRPD